MKKNITYLVNDIPFFLSHRIRIAENAFNEGYSINIIAGKSASKTMYNIVDYKKILSKFNYDEINFESSNLSLIKNFKNLIDIFLLFFKIKPDIVHLISLKPILLGGIICRFFNIRLVVLSFSGFGYLFTGKQTFKKKILISIVLFFIKFICQNKKKKIICQNNEDINFVINKKLAKPEEIVLIKGSGVDLEKYSKIKYNLSKNIILMPSRILKNKGVIEFLEASKKLFLKGHSWQYILIGANDYVNPSSVKKSLLEKFNNKYNIKIYDYKEDLLPFFSKAGIVCLPSHREGMPKSILEGLASGIPIVTTNTVGCKESIIPGVNGELANVNDPIDLAYKLESLIKDESKRLKYSVEARKFAINNFDINDVIKKHIKIYSELY